MMYHREAAAAAVQPGSDQDRQHIEDEDDASILHNETESRSDYESVGDVWQGTSVSDQSSKSTHSHNYGIELVLSPAPTSDSQRAKDCIVSPSAYHRKKPSHLQSYYQEQQQQPNHEQRYGGRSSLMGRGGAAGAPTHDSRSLDSRSLAPLFIADDDDDVSEVSSNVIPTRSEGTKSKHIATGSKPRSSSGASTVSTSSASPPKVVSSGSATTNDDPWRAAKRGDLASLKRFHSQGHVDWAVPDRFGNIPLYYACHSGAIVDLNVVHFLLWVTPIKEPSVLEQCKNRKNMAVMRILNDFEGSGYRASPFVTEEKRGSSDAKRDSDSVFTHEGAKVQQQEKTKLKKISSLRKVCRREFIGGNRQQKFSSSDKLYSILMLAQVLSFDRKGGKRNQTRPTDPGSLVSQERRTCGLPPRVPPASDGDDSQGSRSCRDSSLQSIVEDVNQISVSPSTVTNMTIEGDDEWSMGSMFSFGKKRRQRKGIAGDAALQHSTSVESNTSSDFPRSSRSGKVRGSSFSRGGASQAKSRQGGGLSRKVSFDDKESKRKMGRKLSQPSFRQSPREKLCPQTNIINGGNPPNIEFEDQELRWKIENHISTEDPAQSNVVLTIHVSDSRERVLIQNCHGVSVQVHGRKMKSMLVCDCSNLNVVFDTVGSSCEIVHCKNVAVQTTGVCPTFAMERAKGITVWLSAESMKVSNIVTSKCTEVNVSLPKGSVDNDHDRREMTLPERYVHQFNKGEMKSRVSSVCQ